MRSSPPVGGRVMPAVVAAMHLGGADEIYGDRGTEIEPDDGSAGALGHVIGQRINTQKSISLRKACNRA